MRRFNIVTSLFLLLSMVVSDSFAQREDTLLKVFGYFQNSLQHWTEFKYQPAQNSFGLQQLNLFFQKDFSRNWTAFVNFEALNTYSSSRHWGALNLEEAWVKYSSDTKFNLKLGLQTPIFNNLNDVKNRTPLLPYIIRPLVYETSFNEFIPLEEFVPARAFVQAYGFLPTGEAKFDYAVYLGNSPNINSDPRNGQTGVDTTTAFLVGGRLGWRYRELRLGFSATHEKSNGFVSVAPFLGRPAADLQEIPLKRWGGDLSYNLADFSFESEVIKVNLDAGIPEVDLGLEFFYATLGYRFTNAIYGYGSYWVTDVNVKVLIPGEERINDEEIVVSTAGLAYDLNDRIRFKGQFARVRDHDKINFISLAVLEKQQEKFNIWSIAVSVFF